MPRVLPQNWDVPDTIRARLGTGAGRQRAMVHEGHLLLILHRVPRAGQPEREAALFWRSPDGVWKGAGGGKGGLPALRHVLEEYQQTLDELEQRTSHAARAADYFEVLQLSAPTLRSSRNLLAALQAAREGVTRDPVIISLRDTAADVERAAELVHTDASNGLEYTIAKRGEEQADLAERIAKSGHRLNLLAALFFPVTAVGTMFGMNMHNGLESRAGWVFWLVVATAFCVGFFVRGSIASAGRAPDP